MSKTRKRAPRSACHGGEAAEEGRHLRPLCRALEFWRVCGKPRCRRTLDCKGDAQACFNEFWWQYPEHVRVWVRAAIRAGAGGMSSKAAAIAADAEVARWRDVQMRYAAKPASPALAEKPATAPVRAPMPRIRTL